MIFRIKFPILSLAATTSLTMPADASSLWLSRSNNERSMFADRSASDIGDILTIIVSETTSGTASVQKSTSTSAGANNQVNSYFFPKFVDGLPIINFNKEESSSGGGSVTNSRTIATRASVIVIDRLPNGNLVVEGAREVTVSGETQYAIIRGIVRSDDISMDNTVPSDRLASATIEFLDKGEIGNAQKMGWLSKLLNVTKVW